MRGDAPTYDELAQQVSELTERLESLERRQASNGAALTPAGASASASTAAASSSADERASLTRRRILRGAAATGVGAVAGAVLAAAPAAHAAAGDNMILGANDAGSASTTLASTNSTSAFVVNQNGSAGLGLHVMVNSGPGTVILAEGLHPASTAPVLQGTATGSGFAVYGCAAGTGKAVAGYVASTTSSATAVYGSTAGTGVGVEGKATNGRGGRFTGRFAQINLAPGPSTTHPSTGGVAGDLYADLSGRLWFCRGSNVWVQIV